MQLPTTVRSPSARVNDAGEVDEVRSSSSGRLGRSAGEQIASDEDEEEHDGSSMKQLLRARRRASRFSGQPRLSKSPHAPKSHRLPPPPPPPPKVEVEELADPDPLLTELIRRREGGKGQMGAGDMDDLLRPKDATPLAPTRAPYDGNAARRTSSTGAVVVEDAPWRASGGGEGESHLRYREHTESRRSKVSAAKARREALVGADAALEPIERLLRELTPKELQPEPDVSSKVLKYRLVAAEAVLARCEEALKAEVKARAARFSDENMSVTSADLARGIAPTDLDEMRNLCRSETPQVLVKLLGRCVASVLWTDTVGEAERKGPRPNGATVGEGGLLEWADARTILVRADAKSRVTSFDPRCLLTSPHVVRGVRASVDTSVTSALPVHANVRTRDVYGNYRPTSTASDAMSSGGRDASAGGGEDAGAVEGAAAAPAADGAAAPNGSNGDAMVD